ncbi:tyrosine-type recombinase/integrase [Pseudobutyrivibrio xylanivorans]|uniref:Site-specific integrase n=1 Tax=Pseudobutyrivibrio xylanivorans TaxID=185007 RepID=A0A5P6VMP0_PSEXY|nr:tyrosine-type recombinase/integrase [Pseudobutyrivibrio xylanivorans]QFJ53923.1 site-specific integrase [Pseudobutyrivibrio xylanivorans]
MRKQGILTEKLFFSMTWDYLNVYLPTQHSDSPKTVKSYEDALTVFRRYITDVKKIPMEKFQFEDLTYDFVLDYRIYLVEKDYKPATVNHRLTVISAYMKYAATRRIDLYQIYLNVSDVPYVTVPSRVGEIIESPVIIKEYLASPGSSMKGIRDQVILVVLYDTAIRADELIGLDISDVILNTDEPHLLVKGKGDKERFAALSEKAVPLIKRYISIYHKDLRKRSAPFIYTVIKGEMGRMSERNVERIVKKYADKIREKYPEIPNVYPHMLRRTRATGWYRDGVPIETIAVILGHADAKTTRKSYASPSVEMLREQMEKGTESEPEPEKPLWKNDEELAHICGIR